MPGTLLSELTVEDNQQWEVVVVVCVAVKTGRMGQGKGKEEQDSCCCPKYPGAVVASTSPYVESARLLKLQPCPARVLGEKLLIALGLACVIWSAWGVEKNVDVA